AHIFNDPPIIEEFLTSNQNPTAGQKVKLTWKVRDATEVEIQPGLGKQEAQGSITIEPVPGTYTLIAKNTVGKKTADIRFSITCPAQYSLNSRSHTCEAKFRVESSMGWKAGPNVPPGYIAKIQADGEWDVVRHSGPQGNGVRSGFRFVLPGQ